jgi:hypothetical protein
MRSTEYTGATSTSPCSKVTAPAENATPGLQPGVPAARLSSLPHNCEQGPSCRRRSALIKWMQSQRESRQNTALSEQIFGMSNFMGVSALTSAVCTGHCTALGSQTGKGILARKWASISAFPSNHIHSCRLSSFPMSTQQFALGSTLNYVSGNQYNYNRVESSSSSSQAPILPSIEAPGCHHPAREPVSGQIYSQP